MLLNVTPSVSVFEHKIFTINALQEINILLILLKVHHSEAFTVPPTDCCILPEQSAVLPLHKLVFLFLSAANEDPVPSKRSSQHLHVSCTAFLSFGCCFIDVTINNPKAEYLFIQTHFRSKNTEAFMQICATSNWQHT